MFQNTLKDLRDCEEALLYGNDLSEPEAEASERLIRLCIEIAKRYGPDKVSNALYAIGSLDAAKKQKMVRHGK